MIKKYSISLSKRKISLQQNTAETNGIAKKKDAGYFELS